MGGPRFNLIENFACQACKEGEEEMSRRKLTPFRIALALIGLGIAIWGTYMLILLIIYG